MSNTVPDGPLAPVYRLDDFRSDIRPDPPVDAGDVWAEVMAAARLFGTLRDAGLSVRFELGEAGPPRVRITDLQGRTVREIDPSVACDPEALEAAVVSPAG